MNAQTKIAPAPQVYAAINGVMAGLAKEGITKSRTNTQGQSFKFRGIDDVLNALSGLLVEHKLLMLPRVLNRDGEVRQSSANKPIFVAFCEVEYDLVSVEDGSTHVIRTIGEAMDMSDKASNKAMSAAYKYAAIQAFCIPTEGDNDADAHTHEVANDHRDEPAPREVLEGKHASKSKLATALRAYGQKVSETKTTAELDALVAEFDEDLKQGKRYLPKWMAGDPDNDSKGLNKLTEERRVFLELLDRLRENQTARALSAWLGAYSEEIEALDDAQGREFQRALDEHEAGLKLVETANA